MIPSEVSDNQLISEIKKNNSSEAVTEVISRFSGCYIDICKAYTYVPKFEMDELIQNKDTNIYKYVLDYNPMRNTKLSTYISQRIKWECMSKVNAYKEPISIEDDLVKNYASESSIPVFRENKTIISNALCSIGNNKLTKIVELRYFSDDVMSWHEIGDKMDMSHEGCRKIFNDNIEKLKYFIEKETIGQ